jgi:hypothetical protein
LGVPKPAQVQIPVKHFKSVQDKCKAIEWQSLQRCMVNNRENVNTALFFDKEMRISQPNRSQPFPLETAIQRPLHMTNNRGHG